MTQKLTVAGLFAVSCVAVGVAAGSVTPVAYGVGEATPAVMGAGVLGTLTAIFSGLGGLWALFKNPAVIQAGQEMLGDLRSKDAAAIALNAAFVTIATVALAKAETLDPTLLSELATLKKKILASKPAT